MRFIFPVLFLLSSQIAIAQVFTSGARGAGLGNASVTFRDVNSLFGNQAGLSSLKKFSGMATVERRFMLSELNTVAVGVALPTRSGTFGLVVQNYGFEEFRQQKVGVAYARRMWEGISFGTQFDYLQTRIPEYGSKGLVTFEAGVQAVLSKQVIIGAHLFSPMQVELVENEDLPAVFKLGMSYLPSKKATVVFELEKDIDFPLRIKGGFEYLAAEPLFLRIGFGTNPALVHFGVGVALGSGVKVDMASTYHQSSGLTPSAAVRFE